MDAFFQRITSLSPEQLKMLEQRLHEKGLEQYFTSQKQSDTERTPPSLEEKQSIVPKSQAANTSSNSARTKKKMLFSLYYFPADTGETSEQTYQYQLLFETAKFADENGFAALWTPERHFQKFGASYPNPSLLSAALAMVTKRIQIRAGSIVLPLHHPIRLAEDWAVIDNLSGGRIGISFASGWNTNDFILSPAAFENRKEIMYEGIELIERLWTGEVLQLPGIGGEMVNVEIVPKPLQRKLPIWITTAGSPETWTRAGQMGANMLASGMGQNFDKLAENIAQYRQALQTYEHDPVAGQVTLALHTFIGEDIKIIREKVRDPLSRYLRTYMQQMNTMQLSEDDKTAIALFAFENYVNNSSLIGTLDKCSRMIDQMVDIGVNEVACLIDFGLDLPSVMQSLLYLNKLREHYQSAS